jgi:Zn-dependent M28 family amino/carboxypeptidase
MKQQVVQDRLTEVKRSVRDRKTTLEFFLHDAGCIGDRLTEQKVPGYREPNLVCEMPAEGRTIVVGAHYDSVDRGMGAVDDWSGAAMLPSLYQSLDGNPRRHRFVFIGFNAEERGLLGSAEYVRKLSKVQRAGVAAMVNLECLGTSPPSVWSRRADKQLGAAYAAVARSLGLEVKGMNVDGAGDDDSHSFLNANIPVITIHSLTSQSFRLLHTTNDTLAAIDPEHYYNSYLLVARYLAYLDAVLD